jgi:hypothetical protein
MKTNFLTILTLLLTTMIVNAQDITNYRGAFAPAPVRQWTESWTEFDPYNALYPNDPAGPTLTVVVVSGDINANTTWTSNNVYELSGLVYVNSGVTLTIEPGTFIRSGTTSGNGDNSSLIVARGGKLIAEGTPCKPIVFTSKRAPGSRVTPIPVVNTLGGGSWGGIILLGNAKHNLGTQFIEGLVNTEPRNQHGGNDDADNSGILKYVRIEFGGYTLLANSEINGLTMGSVGNGTTIDYVQVSKAYDDAYEFFGGSVNAKHLVAFQCLDDDLDTDNGFSGTVQYALCIKDPGFSDQSQSEGFESDNSASGNPGLLPKTSAKFLNVTQIGAFRCNSNTGAGIVPTIASPNTTNLHRRGARVRRNSDLKIQNSILMNNWRGLFVDDAVVSGQFTAPTSTNYNEDSAVFRNNIIAGDFTTTWTGSVYLGTKSLAWENSATRTIGTNALYANDSLNTCDLLTDPWNATANIADFRPNAGVGAIATNTSLVSNAPDLSQTIILANPLFTVTQAKTFVVNIIENGLGSTSGQITVNVFKPSGWDVTFNPTGTTGTFSNANWDFTDLGTSVQIKSKPGLIIVAKSGNTRVILTATRKSTTAGGTNQSLSADLSGGGDITSGNNSALKGLSAN